MKKFIQQNALYLIMAIAVATTFVVVANVEPQTIESHE